MPQPKVKVCGVNDAAFAAEAERLGADYLGFIFAPESSRRVTVEAVRAMCAGLTGRARCVGVFTTEGVDEVLRTAHACGLSVVQLHRRATAADVASLRAVGLEVWTLAGGAEGDAVLFDSSHGDGETALRCGAFKTVLAGGVSATNLPRVLSQSPDVIDVSGSLESARGVKSIAKLRQFFAAFSCISNRLASCPAHMTESSCP